MGAYFLAAFFQLKASKIAARLPPLNTGQVRHHLPNLSQEDLHVDWGKPIFDGDDVELHLQLARDRLRSLGGAGCLHI